MHKKNYGYNLKENIFTLLCKNIRICDVKIVNGMIIDIINIYDKKYAPIESFIFNEINISRLNNWLLSRALPVERDGYENIIKFLNIKTNRDFLIDNLALSLSDQYWLRPKGYNLKWEDINFFKNDYNILEFSNAVFGKDNNLSLANTNKIFRLNTSQFITPNASLGGMLKKLWYQEKGENYLLKGANSIYNLEPINECLATKIGNIIGLNCVQYSLKEIKGKRTQQLVSVCKDIVGENEHIVSSYSLILGFPEIKIEDYSSYIEFVEDELDILNAREQIEKMLMLDYIMLNEDRHLNNFGVLRDSNTLKWIKICPVYDTGRSMNTAIAKEYWDFNDGELRSFTGEVVNTDYLENLIYTPITVRMISELKEIKKWYKKVLLKYQEILRIDSKMIKLLINGYLLRIENFEKMMKKKGLLIK